MKNFSAIKNILLIATGIFTSGISYFSRVEDASRFSTPIALVNWSSIVVTLLTFLFFICQFIPQQLINQQSEFILQLFAVFIIAIPLMLLFTIKGLMLRHNPNDTIEDKHIALAVFGVISTLFHLFLLGFFGFQCRLGFYFPDKMNLHLNKSRKSSKNEVKKEEETESPTQLTKMKADLPRLPRMNTVRNLFYKFFYFISEASINTRNEINRRRGN